MGRARIELFGATFGRLTITRYIGPAKKCTWWEARCDCGNLTYVTTQALRRKSGRPTRSCGCLIGAHMKDRMCTPWGSMFRQSLYMQWKRLRKTPLVLCKEWRERYATVAGWCLARGWTPDMRMVRIDVSLPWGPDNVLLAPMRRRKHRRHDVRAASREV